MKKKQVLAVSSALMIGTTTALTGLPTPVMAQENTEVVQEAVVEENKTEQVPVEQKTENAEVQENITDLLYSLVLLRFLFSVPQELALSCFLLQRLPAQLLCFPVP